MIASRDFVEITPDGRMKLHFHPGQWAAWDALRRFVVVLAGTQGGKTSFGPHWYYREIQHRGPGDYIIATPTFPLLELKCLPEFRRLFEEMLALGRYTGSPARRFTFSESGQQRTFGGYGRDYRTNIFFGHAQDPDSLESATAKAAWLDEAGQKKFRLGSWEAILRRLSLHLGRVLITTTIYTLGWLKKKFWDRRAVDPDIDIIRFKSTENPAFPREEYERARRDLPRWKFLMFYDAVFARPAGLIYDCFDERRHTCPRFAIPDDWPRFLGLDFGGVNTVGIYYARNPETRQLYAYREYHAGGKEAKAHAQAILRGEPGIPTCVGGSKSEGQWRTEFRAGGLPVREPDVSDVEVGIDRVYGAHRRAEIIAFDDLEYYLDQKLTYSRKLDEAGEPTEAIEDKNSFHAMDAERYMIGWLNPVSSEPAGEAIEVDPGLYKSAPRQRFERPERKRWKSR